MQTDVVTVDKHATVDKHVTVDDLPVSKKIYFILKFTGERMTCSSIYDYGKPWNIYGLTPRNTITARCSTLYRDGFIQKDCDGKYYLGS
jgi:hypothetical protein